MNILVITPHGMYFDYTLSFVHQQAQAFVQAGHRVRVIVPLAAGKRSNEGRRSGPIVEHLERDGVEICYVRHFSLSRYGAQSFNPASADWMCRLFCRDILRDFKPDVVQGHTITFGGQLTPYFQKKYAIPAVLTTHGGDLNTSLAEGKIPMLRSRCDAADAVAAVSPKLAEGVRSCGTKTPVYTVYNGFAVSHLSSAEKIPHRIVQVGSLVPSKHYGDTLRAVARLRRSYPDVTLAIVGGGVERTRLEALCRELGLTDCAQFLGHLPNGEALAEMAKAEFFVMPSHPEGFGIVYLEAMASGCVTIGTAGEGIDGFIRSGENGFLVPPDDPDAIVKTISWCMTHPKEASTAAQRGKEDACRLTWAHNAEQYIRIFEELQR